MFGSKDRLEEELGAEGKDPIAFAVWRRTMVALEESPRKGSRLGQRSRRMTRCRATRPGRGAGH